jgi:hypothetical protein
MDPLVIARYPGMDALRRRRAELFESTAALDQALRAPASASLATWTERLDVALGELMADIYAHIAITEGPSGLHADVITTAPRLANAVHRLACEHAEITELIDRMRARTHGVSSPEHVTQLRARGSDLLARLGKHRQRGADLVFEAYETDIGGET